MAKKAKTKTKSPQVTKQAAGGTTGAALGDFADRVKAVAAKVEAMVGDASAKGRERIKPVVEKIRAKWHEMNAVEPTDDPPKKLATRSSPKNAKKKKAAKPVKKAAKPKTASTRKAKSPKKGAKKEA